MQKKEQKEEYQDVNLSLIDEPDGRIRIDAYDEDIEGLADNIKDIGQLEPVLLAKFGKRYEIVAGERRFIAIKSIGLKTIKAIVKVMPRIDIALARASENLQRRNLSPIEEGATYADLAKKYNMTLRQIGDKFGKPASSIKNKMDLLRLEPELQQAIHQEKISQAVGKVLNQIDEPKERNKHLKYAIENGCTEDVALIWVNDFRRSSEPLNTRGERGGSMEPTLQTQKIYQACEICEEPVEVQAMKMLRICPGCFKIIIENLKGGG